MNSSESPTSQNLQTANPSNVVEPPRRRPRTSTYHGVTRINRTGNYRVGVPYIDSNKCARRVIYLGTFDTEEKAAKAFDLFCIKYWGRNTKTNFPVSEYQEQLEVAENMTVDELVAAIQRSSVRFRGSSSYLGVRSSNKKWAAVKQYQQNPRLGNYETEEEAAMAFDIASIKRKGFDAVTNFDLKLYDVTGIFEGRIMPKIDRETANQLKAATIVWPFQKKDLSGMRLIGQPSLEGGFSTDKVVVCSASRGGMSRLFELNELPPFSCADGSRFRHSSTSCFKPYNSRNQC